MQRRTGVHRVSKKKKSVSRVVLSIVIIIITIGRLNFIFIKNISSNIIIDLEYEIWYSVERTINRRPIQAQGELRKR